MELNKLEKQIKEQLNSREIKPSEMAWEKLDAMLTVANKKPKRDFKWLYVAASIFGFLLISTMYFNGFETVKINNDASVVIEQKENYKKNIKPETSKEEEVLLNPMQNKAENTSKVVANNQKNLLEEAENKEKNLIFTQSKEDIAIVNSPEKDNELKTKNKYITAEQLLAEVNNTKFETKATDRTIERNKKGIAVNPNDLLLNAESELNQSYRESALDRFNKKLTVIKLF
jgi:hypothetical protein